ncbi:MAG: cell division protein FtsA [Chloroflexi bacterium CG07_land_8_20_14_0_80_45_17]|nr:MAG: cell division protein FtsA [Chloroflexi bacterium CG23_combo_of_CG06-09_8_20_14_all_45_10]PIU55868.1 MAG: cell division protein FtsA [Chloroflexi bacterium CG07_land_8_20_14_0_80_45_17]
MAKKVVSAIDVGTTKIATIVANVRSQDDIEVLGVGVVPSHGLHKGLVVNMDEAKASITESVREAQRVSGMRIDSVYVGVTGRHITSLNNRGVVSIPRDDRLVRSQDLKRVLSAARSVSIPEGKKLLHAIPRYYTLNGEERVKQPVGMHGTRLDVETHIITASVSSVQNLVKCVRSIGVEVEDLILEPLASGEAVLTRQERDSGVIMADVGGGTTDIAVFRDGSIYHTSIIPVAGYQVTSDIAIGLGLPFNIAEKMKKRYGNVTPGLDISKMDAVGIENGHSASYRDLCDIIRSRMEELFELIFLEMPTTDYQTLAPCGVVLTGGTANLTGLAELGKSVLRLPVRAGQLLGAGIYGITDILYDPAYATTTGLILWQARNKERSAWQVKRGGILGSFVSLFRRLFRG